MPRVFDLDRLIGTVNLGGAQVNSVPTTFADILTLQCKCGCTYSQSIAGTYSQFARSGVVCCHSCSRSHKASRWTLARVHEMLGAREIEIVDPHQLLLVVNVVEWKCQVCLNVWNTSIDSIRRGSGCPTCAGNLRLTVGDIQQFADNNNLHMDVLAAPSGTAHTPRKLTCRCRKCQHTWTPFLSNVRKFKYSCPMCNANISKPTMVGGIMFHSKLESLAFESLLVVLPAEEILCQQRYTPDRRFTCDFVIPKLNIWFEISGQLLLTKPQYAETIRSKREICTQQDRIFLLASNIPEINRCTKIIKENYESFNHSV